jgi:hypothetical protein
VTHAPPFAHVATAIEKCFFSLPYALAPCNMLLNNE